jgi:hypothetical protein
MKGVERDVSPLEEYRGRDERNIANDRSIKGLISNSRSLGNLFFKQEEQSSNTE